MQRDREDMEAIIFDTSDGQELRINMISTWLKRHYEELGLQSPTKIVKLSIDGGFTCPNRDGSKGRGGCLFCSESGSGDMASSVGTRGNETAKMIEGGHELEPFESDDYWSHRVKAALDSQIALLEDKWPREKYNIKYIAYFQSHTNTYAPTSKLRELFEAALEHSEVVGLAIATRPDCISDETLELLDELNRRTFLWIELGLQTIHDETAKAMNLCHTRSDYDDALRRLSERDIRVVTHLILGLPSESREDMLESVKYVCRKDDEQGFSSKLAACKGSSSGIFGLKLHMLNVVKGSGMETAYPDYVPFETMEEYIELLIECLELIPPEITLHRISGDAPRSTLIAPEWSYRKRSILNAIHKAMREGNTWQGKAGADSNGLIADCINSR